MFKFSILEAAVTPLIIPNNCVPQPVIYLLTDAIRVTTEFVTLTGDIWIYEQDVLIKHINNQSKFFKSDFYQVSPKVLFQSSIENKL